MRSVRVEDADHADVQVVRAVVVEHDRLRGALALVVARTRTDRVHVPVVLLYIEQEAQANRFGGGRTDRRRPRWCSRGEDGSPCREPGAEDSKCPTQSTRTS